MAVGLPVVATAVGGIPDVVEHAKTGFLVPSADRIGLMKELLQLSTRPQSTRDVANTARLMVLERHSMEHMARDYESLYDRILRRRRSTPHLPAAANA